MRRRAECWMLLGETWGRSSRTCRRFRAHLFLSVDSGCSTQHAETSMSFVGSLFLSSLLSLFPAFPPLSSCGLRVRQPRGCQPPVPTTTSTHMRNHQVHRHVPFRGALPAGRVLLAHRDSSLRPGHPSQLVILLLLLGVVVVVLVSIIVVAVIVVIIVAAVIVSIRVASGHARVPRQSPQPADVQHHVGGRPVALPGRGGGLGRLRHGA